MEEQEFVEFENKHQCESRRDGDWIIFSCSQCDYVRKINYKTNKMEVTGGNATTSHSGFHIPVGLQPEKYNPN